MTSEINNKQDPAEDSDSDSDEESEEAKATRSELKKHLSSPRDPKSSPTDILSQSVKNDQWEVEEFKGHTDIVTCLFFSNNSLYSSSLDGTIRVWQSTKKESQLLISSSHPIYCLVVVGDRIFVGTESPELCIYNLSGELVEKQDSHKGAILCMMMTNGWVLSGSRDSEIRGVHIVKREDRAKFSGHTKGVNCLSGTDRLFASGSDDKTIRLWDTATFGCIKVFSADQPVYTLSYISDTIYHGSAGAVIKTRHTKTAKAGRFKVHTSSAIQITALFMNKEKNLLSCCNDGSLQIWSTSKTKKCVGTGTVPNEVSAGCFQKKWIVALGTRKGNIYLTHLSPQNQPTSSTPLNADSPSLSSSLGRSPSSNTITKSPTATESTPELKDTGKNSVKRGMMANAIKKLAIKDLLTKVPEWGLSEQASDQNSTSTSTSFENSHTTETSSSDHPQGEPPAIDFKSRTARTATTSRPDFYDHMNDSHKISFSSAFESVQGRRWTMEDEHVMIDSISTFNPRLAGHGAFYAVYDGHGGAQVSRLCSEHLHNFILFDEDFEDDPLLAIQKGIQRVDELVRKHAAEDYKNWRSGSTIAILVIYRNVYYAVNVGDSEIVVGQRVTPSVWDAVVLSELHKPESPEEKQRIENAGGYVSDGRVNGILSVSRAVGDIDLKRPYVQTLVDVVPALPSSRQAPVPQNFEFVILACDGLWDVLEYDYAVALVAGDKAHGKTPVEAAETIVKESLNRGTMDNVTAVVVYFD